MDLLKYLDSNFIHSSDTVVSMEQHLNHLIGQPTDTVSTEGFGDLLVSFMRALAEPGKPGIGAMTGGWFKTRENIIKTLEKTYLNPEWLARRRLNTGKSIKLDRSYDYIGIDGVIRFVDVEPAIEDYLEKLTQVTTAYSKYMRNLDIDVQKALRILKPDVVNLSLYDAIGFTEYLERSTARATIDYRTVFGNTHVSRVITPTLDSDKPFNSAKLKEYTHPALSAEEIVQVCNIILSLSKALDAMSELGKDINHLKGFQSLSNYQAKIHAYISQEQSKKFKDPAYEVYIESQQQMIQALDSVIKVPVRLLRFHLNHTDALIRPYAKLIDASVK